MSSSPTTNTTRRSPAGDELDAAAAAFDVLRPRLLGIAARILGSRVDAEDVVQDAWLRWHTCDRTRVRSATAFLVTTTTRLALNAAMSARARRETSVGEWLLEPVDPGEDPATGAARRDALERGTVVLRHLSPAERAAFVLRRGYDLPYPQIAGLLALSEANTRQQVSRAGKRLAAVRQELDAPSATGRGTDDRPAITTVAA